MRADGLCYDDTCDEPATRSGYCPEHKRHRNLAYRYGITPADYERLWRNQRGSCAGCGTTDNPLVVDHDHATGQVRGLLCSPCNRGLGLLGDNPATLTRLLRHLARSPAVASPSRDLDRPRKTGRARRKTK